MAKKVPEAVVKNLSRCELNAKALMHSSLDLSDTLYDFSNWLCDESFVKQPPVSKESNQKLAVPALDIKFPILFGDYNGDNQCMGIGLKAFADIPKSHEIFKMKTNMGLMSSSLIDAPQQASIDAETKQFNE